MAVSHMPHIRGISIWQRTWCKSVECARVHPPLTSVGVALPPIHLLCWESFEFLLSMTVKVRASLTSSTLFSLIYLVVLQSSNWCGNGSCLGLLKHETGVCCCLFGQPNVGYVT